MYASVPFLIGVQIHFCTLGVVPYFTSTKHVELKLLALFILSWYGGKRLVFFIKKK